MPSDGIGAIVAGVLALAVLVAGSSAAAPKAKLAAAEVKVKPAPAGGTAAIKKIVLIAGKDSHGAAVHAHTAGIKLLKACLDTATNVKGFTTVAVFDGWPKDQSVLDGAATIVIFSDGFARHPLAGAERMKKVGDLTARGTGLVCIHYAVAPRRDKTHMSAFLEWLGGYYEQGYSKNPHNHVTVFPATPKHPVCRGWVPYDARDEFYYQIRFGKNDKRVTPIATVMLPKDKPRREAIAWAVQRKDGGRGFGFTGGHFHKNWQIDGFRRMVLNAIVWTAGIDVPAAGVRHSAKTGAR